MLFLLFFLFSNLAKANSVPRYLGYSGTLNSAAGSPVTGNYNIVFKIYNAESGSTALWTETHSVVVSDGFFNVTLGDTTALNLDFSERYWLGITVETDSEMTPRTPISSVGYSFVSDVSYGAFTSSTAASTSTASGGNIYYNTGDGNLYVYDALGGAWVDLTSQGTSIADGTSTSTILTWDGSNWSENTNFLVDASGVVTTGTWHGAKIDISDYTNLAVDGDLVLNNDTLSVSSTIARVSDLHNAITFDTSTYGYLTLIGQEIALGQIDVADTNITNGTGITITNGSIVATLGTDVDLASSEVTGILALTSGGTGATTASDARTALGLGSLATASSVSLTSGSSQITGTLALTNGGTGATTASGARTSLGLGTLATLSAITSAYITDLTITNSDISASAGIVDTKLATISTAGKVSDSALSSNVTKLGSDISLSGSEVSSYLPVSKGGTGVTSWGYYNIPYSYGSSAFQYSNSFIYNGSQLGVYNSNPQHTLDVGGNIGLTNSSYINWGTTDGDTGYGLRDSAGTIQYKNSSGDWSNIAVTIPDPLTGTAGQTITFDSNGAQTASSILYIDSTNSKVGVGTTSPSSTLDVAGTLGGYGLVLSPNMSGSSGSSGSTPVTPGQWVDYSANSVAQPLPGASSSVLNFDDGHTVSLYYSEGLVGETLLVVDSAGTETNTNEIIGTGYNFVAKKVNKNVFVVAWIGYDSQGYYRTYDSSGSALGSEVAFTAGNYYPSSFDFTVDGNSGNIMFMFYNSNYYKTYYKSCQINYCYVVSYSEPTVLAYAQYAYFKSTTLSNNSALFVYFDSNGNAMKYSLFYQGSVASGIISSATSPYPTAIEALPDGKAIVIWNEGESSKYSILDCLSSPGSCSYGDAVTIETVAVGHYISTIPRRLSGGEVALFTTDGLYNDPNFSTNIHYTIYDSTLTEQKQSTTTIYSGSSAIVFYDVSAGFVTNTFAIIYGGYSDPPTNSVLNNYYQVYSGGGVSSSNTYTAVGSAVSIHSLNTFDLASSIFSGGSSIYVYPDSSNLNFNLYDSSGALSSGSNLVTSLYDGNVSVQKLSNDNVVVAYKSHTSNYYGLYAKVYDSAGNSTVPEVPISSSGLNDSVSYQYIDFKMSPMSNSMFFVADIRYFNGNGPSHGYGTYYSMEYSLCDGVSGFCSGKTYIPGYPEAYNLSLTTYGSGDHEKIFIAYTDIVDSVGKYIMYDESMNTFSSPLSFSGVDLVNASSVQTLTNGNIVLFYTTPTGGQAYYSVFDTTLETWDTPQLINSVSPASTTKILSNILNDGSVLLSYTVGSYGSAYDPAFTIFDSTMSTTTQSNTFVYPEGTSEFTTFNVNSVPALDKFTFAYIKKNGDTFTGAEFATFEATGSSGGSSSGSTSTCTSTSSGSSSSAFTDYTADGTATPFTGLIKYVETFANGNVFYQYYDPFSGSSMFFIKDSSGNSVISDQTIANSVTVHGISKINGDGIAVYYSNGSYNYVKSYNSTGSEIMGETQFESGSISYPTLASIGQSNQFAVFYQKSGSFNYVVCSYMGGCGMPNVIDGSASISYYTSATTLSNNKVLLLYRDNNDGTISQYRIVDLGNSTVSAPATFTTDLVDRATVVGTADGGAAIAYVDSIDGVNKYIKLDYDSGTGTYSIPGSAQTLHTATNIYNIRVTRTNDDNIVFAYDDFSTNGATPYTGNYYFTVYSSDLSSVLQAETLAGSQDNQTGLSFLSMQSVYGANKFVIAYGDDLDNLSNYLTFSGGQTVSSDYTASTDPITVNNTDAQPMSTAVFANGNVIETYYDSSDTHLKFVIYDSAGNSVSATTTVDDGAGGTSLSDVAILSDGTAVIVYAYSGYSYYKTYSSTGVQVLGGEYSFASSADILDIQVKAMSDGAFFVVWDAPSYSGGALKYSMCDNTGAPCSAYGGTVEAGGVGDFSFAVTGSGTTEKVLITYSGSITSNFGGYKVFDESILDINGGGSFYADNAIFSSPGSISATTLSDGNVAIFFTVFNTNSYIKYMVWDSTAGTFGTVVDTNNFQLVNSRLSSDVLTGGNVLLAYATTRLGLSIVVYEIFDSTMSSVVQVETVLNRNLVVAGHVFIKAVPGVDGFVLTYQLTTDGNIVYETDFVVYDVSVSSGSSSFTDCGNVDISFMGSDAIAWSIRLVTGDGTIHFLDAQGDDGVYLTQDATSWTSNSDRRLKTNILDLNVLDRIDNFRAVSFNWIKNGNADVGAIAQELYKIFPEVVTVGSDTLGPNGEGAWGIQYSKLGALALEGVKELKQQLDVYNVLLLGGGMDQFINDKSVTKSLVFSRNAAFAKHIALSQDSVGMALIQAGESGVHVTFKEKYSTIPIITLTLASNSPVDKYYVNDVDMTGFTIYIEPKAVGDTLVNWHAFGQLSDEDNILGVSSTNPNISSSNSISSDSLANIANNYLQTHNLTDEDINNASSGTDVTSTTEENIIEETTTSTIVDNITTTTIDEIIVDTVTTTINDSSIDVVTTTIDTTVSSSTSN